jgi:hypothetical protein
MKTPHTEDSGLLVASDVAVLLPNGWLPSYGPHGAYNGRTAPGNPDHHRGLVAPTRSAFSFSGELAAEESLTTGIGAPEIEGLRIEPPADPHRVALMLRVGCIIQCFEKLEIARGAPAVFRRARACTRYAAGQPLALGDGEHLFDHHVVQPIIAEVVEVVEAATLVEMKVTKPCFLDIARLVVFVEGLPCFEISESLTVNFELIEVAVGPAHRSLDRVVELCERSRLTDEEDSPDCRLDLSQRDSQAQRFRGSSCCCHPSILAPFHVGPNGQALSCTARPRGRLGAPKFQCQTLPRIDWIALCHVSCSALLGSMAHGEGE